jgi:hypothetical protein
MFCFIEPFSKSARFGVAIRRRFARFFAHGRPGPIRYLPVYQAVFMGGARIAL